MVQKCPYRDTPREVRRGCPSTADELTKLADLRDRGVISEADSQQGKEKVLKTAA